MTFAPHFAALCLASALMGCAPSEKSLVLFEDVTAKSGLRSDTE